MNELGARRLADAIIKKAVEDYIDSYIGEKTFKNFLYSNYFRILTKIKPDYLYNLARKEKEIKNAEKKDRVGQIVRINEKRIKIIYPRTDKKSKSKNKRVS